MKPEVANQLLEVRKEVKEEKKLLTAPEALPAPIQNPWAWLLELADTVGEAQAQIVGLVMAMAQLETVCKRLEVVQDVCERRQMVKAHLHTALFQLYEHVALCVRPSRDAVRERALRTTEAAARDPRHDALLDEQLRDAEVYGTGYDGPDDDATPSQLSGCEVYGPKGEWVRYVAERVPGNEEDADAVAPVSIHGYLMRRRHVDQFAECWGERYGARDAPPERPIRQYHYGEVPDAPPNPRWMAPDRGAANRATDDQKARLEAEAEAWAPLLALLGRARPSVPGPTAAA